MPRKEKKREARREEKAEKAAILDKVCYISSFVNYFIVLFVSISTHDLL